MHSYADKQIYAISLSGYTSGTGGTDFAMLFSVSLTIVDVLHYGDADKSIQVLIRTSGWGSLCQAIVISLT